MEFVMFKINILVTGHCVSSPIMSVIIVVIKNWNPPFWWSDFVNHLMYQYDYRPNCTTQCPSTIFNISVTLLFNNHIVT